MEFNFDYFAELEPQKYYENKDMTPNAIAKREAMLSNKENNYIISEKHDGEWSMSIITSTRILVRSRSRGVNGNFGDFTDKIPHITAELKLLPPNTVILGELCYLDYSKTSKDVGSILRCLTPKAIARQEDEAMKLHLVVFDCLCENGISYMDKTYAERIARASIVINGSLKTPNNFKYIQMTKWTTNGDFNKFVGDIWDAGGEGGVIQRMDSKYAPGTRPSWQSLKVKKHISDIEVQVTAINAPTREYSGLAPEGWPYKDPDGTLVTKYWYNNWAGGITVDYKGKAVSISSGLSDEDRQWLVTDEAREMIKQGKLIAVIGAMEETKDSLRHPIVQRLRTDAK